MPTTTMVLLPSMSGNVANGLSLRAVAVGTTLCQRHDYKEFLLLSFDEGEDVPLPVQDGFRLPGLIAIFIGEEFPHFLQC